MGWLRQTLTVGANPNVCFLFSHVQVILPNSAAASTFFFGNSLASWFLKNRSSFWHWNRMNILLYSDGLTAPRQWFGRNLCIFFVLGDVGCCCFHQEKHNFTPMIWLIWEKWSMGHFLMGHSKGAVYSSSQNRKGVFLEYCTGNLYRLLLKHFLSEMHHWIGDASILTNSHPKKSLPYSMAKGMQLLGTFKTP